MRGHCLTAGWGQPPQKVLENRKVTAVIVREGQYLEQEKRTWQAVFYLTNTPCIMFPILPLFPNIVGGVGTQSKATLFKGVLNIHSILSVIDGDLWALPNHLNRLIHCHLRYPGLSCLDSNGWCRRVWVSHTPYFVCQTHTPKLSRTPTYLPESVRTSPLPSISRGGDHISSP